jgi:hypothetical protein
VTAPAAISSPAVDAGPAATPAGVTDTGKLTEATQVEARPPGHVPHTRLKRTQHRPGLSPAAGSAPTTPCNPPPLKISSGALRDGTSRSSATACHHQTNPRPPEMVILRSTRHGEVTINRQRVIGRCASVRPACSHWVAAEAILMDAPGACPPGGPWCRSRTEGSRRLSAAISGTRPVAGGSRRALTDGTPPGRIGAASARPSQRPPPRHRRGRSREFVSCHAPCRRLGRRQPGPPLTGAPGSRALKFIASRAVVRQVSLSGKNNGSPAGIPRAP